MDPTGGILSYVANKLGDLILQEAALLANTQEDLKWVQTQLRMMQAVLNDVATMEIHGDRIVTWIEEVRKLAFHAEDVVDTFSLHAGRSFLSRYISRHKFGTEIAQLRKKITELRELGQTYGINIPDSRIAGVVDPRTDDLLQFRKLTAAPHVEDKDVVGLDHHVSEVVGLLALGGSRRSVVSIVGMGGLGKTTLAKKVYNNQSSFDCAAWVCVSQKYSFPDLLRDIAREFLKLSQKEQEMNQDIVMANLCEFLRSKKYLIVLDDVWTSELWSQLDAVLPDPRNGSRIVVTTRNVEVAKSANPNMSPYELPALGEEESRVLFTKKVFPDEEDPEQVCTGELASLRDKIVRKCGGMPLAIIVAGGLLSTRERSVVEWRKMAEKIDWQQTGPQGGQCMEILALSYVDLPVHLRWCFLYLAAAPEDCEVSTKHLVRLWIAEGFIEEKDGKSSAPEETAERHLDELTQRCLIQVFDGKDASGMPERYCRLHDMVLELAVSEAKKIGFLHVWRSAPEAKNPGPLMRRLSFAHDGIEEITIQLPESNKLRTLVIMDRTYWRLQYPGVAESPKIRWHSSVHKNLKLLRVLQLGARAGNLTEGIGHMVNLRYLKLSYRNIRELPSSLGNLRHLQTLDLQGTRVECLPKSIWQIKTLRHLLGSAFNTRLQMPRVSLPHCDIFKNLRTLRYVIAGPWTETILPCSINLRELEIECDEGDVLPMSRYLCRAISKLQCLTALSLSVKSGSEHKVKIGMDDAFSSSSDSHEYLRYLGLYGPFILSSPHGTILPQNLTEVILVKAEIDQNTLGLLGNLRYLQMLELYFVHFLNREMVFRSGWFPQLHVLHVRLDFLHIKRWEVEEESMPLLSELEICDCQNLEELPQGLQHITTLKTLTLWDARSQLRERLRRPQEERPGGDDWYKVQHIQHVVFTNLEEQRLTPLSSLFNL